MHEPLIDRIADLERSNRRWKWTAAILAAALVGVTSSSVFLGVFGLQRHAREQAELARMAEMEALAAARLAEAQAAQAEAARKQADLDRKAREAGKE